MIGRWAGERQTPDPIKPMLDRIKLKGGEAVEKLPRTLVRCTRSPHVAGDLLARRAREAGWAIVELDAGHMPMFSAPRALVEILLQIAEPYGL
jgi:hypothetical protein